MDNVAAPFRFIDELGTDDFGYGLYLTVWGAGALLGVQLLPRLPERRHPAALAIGNLVTGIGIAGIGIAPTVVLAQVASAVGGIGNGLVNVTENALIARHTPTSQHGRAFAAAGAVMQTAIGVGTAAAAPLVATVGAGHAMAIAGLLAAVAALLGLAYPAIARFGGWQHSQVPNVGRSVKTTDSEASRPKETSVLIFAEGAIHRPVEGDKQTAAEAWLGPMVDAGFMQAGYHDAAGNRVLMILSAETMRDVDQRLADLPVVRDGSVTFRTSHVTALRFI